MSAAEEEDILLTISFTSKPMANPISPHKWVKMGYVYVLHLSFFIDKCIYSMYFFFLEYIFTFYNLNFLIVAINAIWSFQYVHVIDIDTASYQYLYFILLYH